MKRFKEFQDELQEFIDLYNNSQKKDDLADCYLQGVFWDNKYLK